MSNPEISRRCSDCGASFREAALFCPQCGKQLTPRNTASPLLAAELNSKQNTAPLDNSEIADQQSLSETMAIQQPGSTSEPPPPSMSDTIAIEPKPKSFSDTIAIEKPRSSQKTVSPRGRVAVGGKLQRATSIARGVEGDVKNRVQKVRKISSVVIDEAGYDPSLRFVLVAAGLFVLFLVIVLLNRIIS